VRTGGKNEVGSSGRKGDISKNLNPRKGREARTKRGTGGAPLAGTGDNMEKPGQKGG